MFFGVVIAFYLFHVLDVMNFPLLLVILFSLWLVSKFGNEFSYFTSLTEIQNARGIMDVLSEMLHALDPGNREVLSW